MLGISSSPKKACTVLPYTRHTQSGSERLRARKLLSRPKGTWGNSVFLPAIRCRREAPRCPEKRTAVKIMQSSGFSLMETAARLRSCTAMQGLTLRHVLTLSVPLATQHGRMLNFSSSRVTSGTKSSKNCKQKVFSRQLPLRKVQCVAHHSAYTEGL